MAEGPLAMGADVVGTVRVFMSEGPLVRGVGEVVGSRLVVEAGSSDLRSIVRCPGESG